MWNQQSKATDCNRYWALADYLPVETVVEYWCQKSGFDAEHCKAAKIAAIVTACERNAIKYGRDDGRDFKDPPSHLAARNCLTIERESFDVWVMENFENESPLPEKPLGTKERDTLLKLVIGMAIKGYSHDPAASKSTTSKEISDDLAEIGISINDDTVRKYLKQAAAAVLPAKQRQP